MHFARLFTGLANQAARHNVENFHEKLAGMMGYSFPGEETAKFQAYSSIDQNCWDQKLAAVERLPVFDDGENESLDDDVHSFVDKTIHLTSAVLRQGVEMSML